MLPGSGMVTLVCPVGANWGPSKTLGPQIQLPVLLLHTPEATHGSVRNLPNGLRSDLVFPVGVSGAGWCWIGSRLSTDLGQG